MERIAVMTRNTNETKISMTLNLDGRGKADIHTGIGFFDHMLNSLARHGFFDLELHAQGDLEVDTHHTIEDVGIVLGRAIPLLSPTASRIARPSTIPPSSMV